MLEPSDHNSGQNEEHKPEEESGRGTFPINDNFMFHGLNIDDMEKKYESAQQFSEDLNMVRSLKDFLEQLE